MATSPRRAPLALTKTDARRIWLRAQRLDARAPFGGGAGATHSAVEHLGYVQIDTINVIERCHHHILWTRIPDYRRAHLHQAQTIDKTVFEYWTHALAYVPSKDFRFFMPGMKRNRQAPRMPWNRTVTDEDLRKVHNLIRKDGALTIRDITDDVLVEKDWLWASRKPSKHALEEQFRRGVVTVSERTGMVKTYELTGRHFGWDKPPRPATERQILAYKLDRALRAQGLVSLDSACYHEPRAKPAMRALIESRVRRKELVPVTFDGAGKVEHWAEPHALESTVAPAEELVHVLSPFDPLIIQRKRLALFFDYRHIFEAYVPKEKRAFGYFALPVLVGDEIVAAIDLKTDREKGTLLIQQWTWVGNGTAAAHKARIEAELDRFETFQLRS
ncbi:winged helix DNA-binding domain-containing protein [Actinopolymorpha sp. B9G3]|uniref:winged helix-turn-helix domain-containing protein n=1 Tax=Actinopolymorpha sp. B9G3 TaxID=3158970 RepID=UPI0032D98CF0